MLMRQFRSMYCVEYCYIRVQVPITDIMKPRSITLGMSLRYRPQRKLTYSVGSKATPLGINSTTRMSLRWNPCTSNLKTHTKTTPGMLRVSKCDSISETEVLGKLPRDAGRK